MPSEFELIARYFSRAPAHSLRGVGDDAALVRVAPDMDLAVSTDALQEGPHFSPGAEARALGHKALAVNLSDMAATGATPRWATLALALPAADERWLAAFAEGFYGLAARFGVDLVGGDTSRGPLTICVCILGEVPRGQALSRGGARSGDEIWVSGALGGAALALRRPEVAAVAKRLHEPEPRVLLGERLRGVASAAIDVSDGFAQDLGHILERSKVGAEVVYSQLPQDPSLEKFKGAPLEWQCVLSGGDDYELIFTAPPEKREEIEALRAELSLALSRVGVIEGRDGKLKIMDEKGNPIPFAHGYDHFA